MSRAACTGSVAASEVELLGRAPTEGSFREADKVAKKSLARIKELRTLSARGTANASDQWKRVTEYEYQVLRSLSEHAANLGLHDRALAEAQEALQLAKGDIARIHALLYYSRLLKDAFDPRAIEVSSLALQEAEQQYNESPASPEATEAFIAAACNCGDVLWFWGRVAEAHAIHRQNERMAWGLFKQNPTRERLETVILAWKWLGYEEAEMNLPALDSKGRAERWPLKGLGLLADKGRQYLEDHEVRRWEAELHKAVGYCRDKDGAFETAMESHDTGISILKSLFRSQGTATVEQRLANARLHAARTQISLGRYEAAISEYIDPALATMQRLLKTPEGARNYYWRENAADLHYERARALRMRADRRGESRRAVIIKDVVASSLVRAPIARRDSSNARLRVRVAACARLEHWALEDDSTPRGDLLRAAIDWTSSLYSGSVVLREDIERKVALLP